jgi:hypothetical protein
MDESSSNTLTQMAEVVAEARSILANCQLPSDPRTAMELEIFNEMIQEHETMFRSCRNGDFHDMIQHSRRIMEYLYKGIWIGHCAEDSQITHRNMKQVFPRSTFRMAQEIDATCRANGHFEELRIRIWKIHGRFVESELKQAGRRKTERGIEPPYSDEEIKGMVTTCTTCILLFAEDLLTIHGLYDKGIEIEMTLSVIAT